MLTVGQGPPFLLPKSSENFERHFAESGEEARFKALLMV